MIDLHSHILPGVDDGSASVAMSLEMARRYEDQGVTCVACTPHIRPGIFCNTGDAIRSAVADLQAEIFAADIKLELTTGADNHVAPGFVKDLHRGHLLSLADTRYVLVEPPHHVAPPRLESFFLDLVEAGLVPILTHPERLAWIEARYAMLTSLVRKGVWLQVTAGALIGQFGKGPKYWAERMLSDNLVHILASDAHGSLHRPPNLLEGRLAAEKLIGGAEAEKLTVVRPRSVLRDASVRDFSQPLQVVTEQRVLGGGDIVENDFARSRGYAARCLWGHFG